MPELATAAGISVQTMTGFICCDSEQQHYTSASEISITDTAQTYTPTRLVIIIILTDLRGIL